MNVSAVGWRITACGALLLTVLQPAAGHHSFAVFFDEARTVSVTGIVQEFQFRNPHGLIRVAVKGEAGEVTWKAETNSPSILERRGWRRDTIKAGETITIEGWPARDGSNYIRLRAARRSDGSVVGSAPRAETTGEQR
jgi:hypothetical protein